MSVGAILTLGLGTYSDINHVVTLGYGTGAEPPPPPQPAQEERPAGGYTTGVGERRRRREDIVKARERFGIPDEARLAIEEVARRQAERLEMDRQKQYDELVRELELRRIEYRTGYLEVLAAQRESLITEEIKRRFQVQDDEAIVLLTLIAAACALD